MKAIGGVIRGPLKLLGILPKTPKPPTPLRTATRDDARAASSLEEELRNRRGGASDMLSGAGGAEAGSGGRTQLG